MSIFIKPHLIYTILKGIYELHWVCPRQHKKSSNGELYFCHVTMAEIERTFLLDLLKVLLAHPAHLDKPASSSSSLASLSRLFHFIFSDLGLLFFVLPSSQSMIIFNTGVEIPLDPKGFAFIQSTIRFQVLLSSYSDYSYKIWCRDSFVVFFFVSPFTAKMTKYVFRPTKSAPCSPTKPLDLSRTRSE